MNPPRDSDGVAAIEQITRLEKALFDNVSHELKTPLTVISAALDQLEPDRPEIAEAVRRLNRTIDNFLTAARLDAGQMKPFLEWCEPDELIREAVASVTGENHEIRVMIPVYLPFIFVDASFIERILGLLLANAITHSPAEPMNAWFEHG